jgi:hypothetical protein
MGFLSRLFGRVQEEPLARPEAPPPAEPEEPAAPDELAAPEEGDEPEEAPPPADEKVDVAEPAAESAEPPPPPAARARPAPARPRQAPAFPAPPPSPVPEPAPDLPKVLSLTLDEATAALRGAGSDGIRIGFISREYLRAAEEERPVARRKLVGVLTEQLRARGLLAEDGSFELREEPALAKPRGG